MGVRIPPGVIGRFAALRNLPHCLAQARNPLGLRSIPSNPRETERRVAARILDAWCIGFCGVLEVALRHLQVVLGRDPRVDGLRLLAFAAAANHRNRHYETANSLAGTALRLDKQAVIPFFFPIVSGDRDVDMELAVPQDSHSLWVPDAFNFLVLTDKNLLIYQVTTQVIFDGPFDFNQPGALLVKKQLRLAVTTA